MKFSDIERVLDLNYAISKIKSNNNHSYIWFTVKNKTGCIFEIGGTNKELKIYVPHYDENGLPKKYAINEMVHMNFTINTSHCHVNDGVRLDEKKFLSIAKNKDFRKARFERGHSLEVVVTKHKDSKLIFSNV